MSLDLSKMKCLNADFPPAPACCECGDLLPRGAALTLRTRGDAVLQYCDPCAAKMMETL